MNCFKSKILVSILVSFLHCVNCCIKTDELIELINSQKKFTKKFTSHSGHGYEKLYFLQRTFAQVSYSVKPTRFHYFKGR